MILPKSRCYLIIRWYDTGIGNKIWVAGDMGDINIVQLVYKVRIGMLLLMLLMIF